MTDQYQHQSGGAQPATLAILHDKEAEQGVLGTVLLNNAALDEVRGLLEPQHFYSPAHQVLFKAMLELRASSTEIDEITLGHYLRARGQMDRVGGMAYVVELADVTPSSSRIQIYAEAVLELATQRGVLDEAEKLRSGTGDVGERLDQFTERVQEISHKRVIRSGLDARAVVTRLAGQVETYEKESAAGREYTPIPIKTHTPFDSWTGGAPNGYTHVIAARQKNGKSMWLDCIGTANAERGHPGAVFSLEMPPEDWAKRAACRRGRIKGYKIMTGNYGRLTEAEWDAYVAALGWYSRLPLYFEGDAGPLTMADITHLAHYHVREHCIEWMAVDHLSLIQVDGRDDRERQGKRSRALRALAKELRIPIFVAVQINREGEDKPRLKDLEWSDYIGQDAYNVYLMQAAPGGKNQYQQERARDHMTIELAANRNGATGTMTLTWEPDYFAVGPGLYGEELAPVQEEAF